MGIWSKLTRQLFPKTSNFDPKQGPDLDSSNGIGVASEGEVMTWIYSHKKWGGTQYDFYSGFGSHSKKLVKPYVRTITDFLCQYDKSLVVCDLGCGDFNVGSQLVPFSKKYIAVDVVAPLIERNKKLFKDERLSFSCLNVVKDSLPDGDCILVRQVLQHLSNEAISKAIAKFRKYRFLMVTEHLPKNGFVPNLDKETGANIRLSRKSGVVLHAPPFDLSFKRKTELLKIKYNKGVVVTTLYEF